MHLPEIVDRIYTIYSECFPENKVTKEVFLERLNIDNKDLLLQEEDGKTIGFSLLEDNVILMLCVTPSHRGKGYGSKLLIESEQRIKAAGFSQVILGAGQDYLYPGIPFSKNQQEIIFFDQRGYGSDWNSADLLIDFKHTDKNKLLNQKHPNTVTFRYALPKDEEKLLKAVIAVDPSWAYYIQGSEDSAYLAIENEQIIGFALVSEGDHPYSDREGRSVGGVGCVGIVPEARSRGAGLALVAKSTLELEKMGCDLAFIGYTHLKEWYSKLGYEVIAEYWMGTKDI